MRSIGWIICLMIAIFALSSSGVCQDASNYYDSLAGKLVSAGNLSEGLDLFNKSLDQNQSNDKVWVHKGNAEKALRDYNASIRSYNKAIDLEDRNAAAWSGLADAYTVKMDYRNATVAVRQLTGIDPKNKGYWLRIGTLQQMQGDFGNATSSLDRALAIDEKYKDALYRKAISELSANKTAEATALLDQVIAADSKNKQAYNARGQARQIEGDHKKAISEYEKALQIDPKWSPAQINKMHALFALGRQKEAVDILLRI